MRSPEGSSGSVALTHQQETRRPATSSAPCSPTSQVPSRAGSGTSPVRACSSRASWSTRSPSRPSATRSGPSRRPSGRVDGRAAARVQRGISQACASAASETGSASGDSSTITIATTHERDDVRDRRQRPQALALPQAPRRHARAPVDARQLRQGRPLRRAAARAGSAAMRGRAGALPAGDRAAHDHEALVERQLAHVLGVPGPRVTIAIEPLLQLLAEGGDGRLDRRGSSAVHSASVVWPVRSMRMSRDISSLLASWVRVIPSYARRPARTPLLRGLRVEAELAELVRRRSGRCSSRRSS